MIFPDILSVDVLLEDIDASKVERKRFDRHEITGYTRSESCPMALALKRQFPDASKIMVMPWAITIEYDNIFAQYNLSDEVLSFINHADEHDNVEPTFLETKIRSISVLVNGRFQEIFQRALTDK